MFQGDDAVYLSKKDSSNKSRSCQLLLRVLKRSNVRLLGSPASLLYRKRQACPSPPFHISITSSLGITAAARPAVISSLSISPRPISGRSQRDVRASFLKFSQDITFKFGSLVGQRCAKKPQPPRERPQTNFRGNG